MAESYAAIGKASSWRSHRSSASAGGMLPMGWSRRSIVNAISIQHDLVLEACVEMKQAQTFFIEQMATPIGAMLVVTDVDGSLRAVDWPGHEQQMSTLLRRQYRNIVTAIVPHPSRSDASRALEAYFTGNINAINGLPVAMGGTDFQKRVWLTLLEIPAGQTISYATLAARMGQPNAIRAVGLANGANLMDIVVPCHRVVGSNGSLTGYGGGLERKRWLLDHERQWAGPDMPDAAALAPRLAVPPRHRGRARLVPMAQAPPTTRQTIALEKALII